MNELPKVVLIGRSNVGKSTLFNRLVGKKMALTSSIAGTTRDTTQGLVQWRDSEFILIDTGGLDIPDTDDISKGIIRRAKEAVQGADACIFVLDTTVGIIESERAFAKFLNAWKKPVLVAANKCDRPSLFRKVKTFEQLGFGEAFACSAKNGSGTGDLLDQLLEKLPANPQLPTNDQQQTTTSYKLPATSSLLTIALIGKPNAGKSSLMNALAGFERSLVSATPHTTRDIQKETLTFEGQTITFLDTAGLRRQKQARTDLEAGAFLQLTAELNNIDIAWLLIESYENITDQDQRLLHFLEEAGLSVLLIFTKSDLMPPDHVPLPEREKYLRRFLPHADFLPALFMSTQKKFDPRPALTLSFKMKQARQTKFPEELLEQSLRLLQQTAKKTARKPHPMAYPLKLKQTQTSPPRLALTILGQYPYPSAMLTMLEKKLRSHIDLVGTPIRFQIIRQLGKK